jgi:hypothetical protein
MTNNGGNTTTEKGWVNWVFLILVLIVFISVLPDKHNQPTVDKQKSTANAEPRVESPLSLHQPTHVEIDLPKPQSLHQPTHVEIDLPKLAFAKADVVEKALGRPINVKKDANHEDWSEGPILNVRYKGAECLYLRGRLVQVIYTFKKRPTKAEDALEWTGFPREAASLDNEHENHLPYRAFYAPNAAYRNPIHCCGLLFQWVSISEAMNEIWVNFANINDHFLDWPEEIRSAWLRAGGESIDTEKAAATPD